MLVFSAMEMGTTVVALTKMNEGLQDMDVEEFVSPQLGRDDLFLKSLCYVSRRIKSDVDNIKVTTDMIILMKNMPGRLCQIVFICC